MDTNNDRRTIKVAVEGLETVLVEKNKKMRK